MRHSTRDKYKPGSNVRPASPDSRSFSLMSRHSLIAECTGCPTDENQFAANGNVASTAYELERQREKKIQRDTKYPITFAHSDL